MDTSRGEKRDREALVIRGRKVGERELSIIRRVVHDLWDEGRSSISREVCRELEWRQENNRLKDRACREVLSRLSRNDLITLPPPKTNGRNAGSQREAEPAGALMRALAELEKGPPITQNFTPRFEMVRLTPEEKTWNALVRRYHYLGHKIIVGRYLKYIVYRQTDPVACLGWGEGAWHLQPRDQWIGWDDDTRRRNLRRVINNVRFVILPWARLRNLASRVLAEGAHRVRKDWGDFYGEEPLLLETFVDPGLFLGTCYKAANWKLLGETKGWGKRGARYYLHGTKKEIYVYPLRRNAREHLCNGEPSSSRRRNRRGGAQ